MTRTHLDGGTSVKLERSKVIGTRSLFATSRSTRVGHAAAPHGQSPAGTPDEPTVLVQRWESRHRYYCLMLAPNLFGEWELVQAWGGKGNRLGRLRALPVADYAAGLNALERNARQRARRGYCLMHSRAV